MKDGGKVALGIAGGSLALLVLWGLTKLIKPAPPAPDVQVSLSWD